jgi:glucose/arabinose dehydrogenase
MKLTSTLLVALFAGLGLSVTACADAQPSKPMTKAPEKQAEKATDGAKEKSLPSGNGYTVEVVASGLQVPWDLAWDHTGRMLITERTGKIRVVKDGKLLDESLFTVDDIRTGGEIGLMGMCLHPDFKNNGYIYVAYGHRGATPTEADVRVMRLKEANGKVSVDKVILTGLPAAPAAVRKNNSGKESTSGSNHAGCSVRFGPDGKLYISMGERFEGKLAQDMNSLGGKILRVNDDGSIPKDNPFVGKEGVRGEIWAYGVRNPQGIDWQPGTGKMFESEHGPSGEKGANQDEFNFIEKGKNYGWPVISGDETKEGMVSPLINWTPAVAPASCKFYNGDKFPAWKGKVLVGALGGLRGPKDRTPGIIVITLDGEKVASQERIATEFGRIRNVNVGPDGFVYFTTSNKDGRGQADPADDRVMRLVPSK